MDHAGAAVGPLLATVFLWFAPDQYRVLFALTIIPGALAVLTLTRVPESGRSTGAPEHPSTRAPEHPGTRAPEHPPRLPRGLKRYLLILTVFMLGNSSDAFLLLQMSNAGMPLAGLTIVWSAQHAIKAALSTRGGALSDRLGRRTMIVSGWAIYAVVYAGFAFSDTLPALVAWFLVYSMYAAAVEGTEKALVADLAPVEARATAFGWYSAVQGFGALGASVIFGAIFQWYGAPAAFTTGASLALGAAALLRLLVPDDRHGRGDHRGHV
jgi:MFS family permease